MESSGGNEVMQIMMGIFWLIVLVGGVVGSTSIIWAVKNRAEGGLGFESKQLHFAAVTLTGISLLFALAMAMYFFGGVDSPGQDIFEVCKTILPPIVTLILGFYFGRESRPRDANYSDGRDGA